MGTRTTVRILPCVFNDLRKSRSGAVLKVSHEQGAQEDVVF